MRKLNEIKTKRFSWDAHSMSVDSSLNTMSHACGYVGPAAGSVTVRSHEECCAECCVMSVALKGGQVSRVSVDSFCSTGSSPIAENGCSISGGGESYAIR